MQRKEEALHLSELYLADLEKLYGKNGRVFTESKSKMERISTFSSPTKRLIDLDNLNLGMFF